MSYASTGQSPTDFPHGQHWLKKYNSQQSPDPIPASRNTSYIYKPFIAQRILNKRSPQNSTSQVRDVIHVAHSVGN
ncbi:hypothetical protein CULCOIPH002_00710 [Corynebacterium ulcerans]|uniref:Transposase n=1 Tax=Corynebacterium ulcerans TaxID=65058 RepID=A0ABD0BJE1_CORUL|nr:hypothetical protein CULCOIPH001_14140 [Corynebacterium ulcerans]GJJ35159.1 hypothetical protein CULCOIPH002_00710 [Corynebacterium ulcerans]GJJ38406.1 hypothetical protein CULCOIPH003_10370 [Corynebacterium ulcerans]GJJ41410.1 hypothetical protein CULCOIPH004_18210 [Corynebacterium ulcerans]GJJ42670.1 hypothetical protein CULCOIPH005_08590 [Corynebacterium ulcerans]